MPARWRLGRPASTQTLRIVIFVAKRIPLQGIAQFAAVMLVSLATSIAAGLIVHRFIERPLIRRLSGRPVPVSSEGEVTG